MRSARELHRRERPEDTYDVVVAGAGPAGIAAAAAAAKNEARTLLVEMNSYLGGELASGLPIDGGLNARGEWIIGGVARELLALCDTMGGYIGPAFDWRLNYGVCFDPEIMKIAIIKTLDRYGVALRLGALVCGARKRNERVRAITTMDKSGVKEIAAAVVVDCTGDGDVSAMAGAGFEVGGRSGELQPVSLIFRMADVRYDELLRFVRDHPDEFVLRESPVIRVSRRECARRIHHSGMPFVSLSASGRLLKKAIAGKRVAPCTAIFMWPTSLRRNEIGINMTRIADLDALNPEAVSRSLTALMGQVELGAQFLKKSVPGFSDSYLCSVAPRVGVRETRRIVGDYVLNSDDVRAGRKRPDGVAKGAHHIDIHGKNTAQKRIPVEDGRSYDIPFGCLIPKNLKNVLIAGRILSSTREANGSARVMGTCLATGEAAGTAAAICAKKKHGDVRKVDVAELRAVLKRQGAVVDGTH